MKKKFVFKTALIFMLLCAATAVSAILLSGVNGRTAKADSDKTYAYANSSIVIDVDETKVLHVKEKLKIGFVQSVSGITRRIPAKTESYKNRKGKAVKNGSFLAKISGVSAAVNGKAAETDYGKNGTCYYLTVKNPDGRFDVWEKGRDELQYDVEIEYDYDLSDDGAGKNALALRFFDEVDPLWFYYGEDTSNIARLNVTINMPKAFDGELADVYFGNNNISESAGLKCEGNSLNFSVSMKDASGNSVRILLDDNYFNTQVTRYTFYWYFVGLVGIIILICIILTVVYRGKKPVSPVEVAPPVVNPLHYSAYWHGYPQRKDVTTIILYWAQLGCIKITKDGKKDLVLTRLKPLPDKCTIAEKRYFAELFRYGDKFYSRETRGWENRDRKNRIRLRVNALVEESERPTPFVPQVERTKMFVNILSVIAIAVVYAYFILLSWDWIWMTVVPLLLGVTLLPLVKLHSVFSGMGNLKQKDRQLFRGVSFMSLFLIIPIGLFVWFLFSTQYMAQYDYIHITIISVAWALISFFVLPEFIKRRTDEAQELYGRMLGFKRFILLADLPRMELLLKDNPDYFYDVLPYCMVMGLSKKVDGQMQYLGVAVPDWADGFNPSAFAEELFYSVKHAIIVRRKRERRNKYALDD